MKKVIYFLLSIILILAMVGGLFLVSVIYNTPSKITVDAFFFQPQRNYESRISEPIKISDYTDDELRNKLLEKYLIEYFYVIPDINNAETRRTKRGALWLASMPKVYNEWLETIAPEIVAMANSGMLRTVKLISAQKVQSNSKQNPYWRVEYELTTWERPNDFFALPNKTVGVLFMQIHFSPHVMETMRTGESVLDYLESGKDPAAAFSFGIIDIAREL